MEAVGLQDLEADVCATFDLHYMPDADFVLDWGWPLAAEGEILMVGLEVDPTVAANSQGHQKESPEDDHQEEDRVAVGVRQVWKVDGVVVEEVEVMR